MQDLEAPKYEDDFYSWSFDQADRLRELQSKLGTGIRGVDFENLIEEVESLGRQEKNTLASHMHQVIIHLCLIAYTPKSTALKNVNHWLSEIETFRENMLFVLDESPGLKGKLDELCSDEWEKARNAIIRKVDTVVELSHKEKSEMRRDLERKSQPTPDEILGFDWTLHKHGKTRGIDKYFEADSEAPRYPPFVKEALAKLEPELRQQSRGLER